MSYFVSSDGERKAFQIRGSAEFASRTNFIFNGLNELEEKHDKWKAESSDTADVQKPEPCSTSEFLDCKNVVFKRPRLPLSLKRKRNEDVVPDYVMNPHKWKKYSLADTPNITEESNAAVALQFLQDLKKKRQAQIVANDEEIITYRKPSTVQDEVPDSAEQESEERSSLSFTCSSVHRMPELVVGEKKKKPTKSFKSNTQAGVSVRLDHLEEHLDDL